MHLTATHVNYFFICHRKLWLFSNGICMEHTSDTVYEGKLIGQTTYTQRSSTYTEIEVGGSRIDFYDTKNKVVHEIKKSDKAEEAHQWQVKYYLLLLAQNGIKGATGVLEYPKLREKKHVALNAAAEEYLQAALHQIKVLVDAEQCPLVLHSKICRNCAYEDFCYVAET